MKKTFLLGALLLGLFSGCTTPPAAGRGEWRRDDKTLAWRVADQDVWQFSFDATKGKTFFNPLSVAGGPSLTNFRPEDHPWHYGLWFSWKYINHVNYWEEDRAGDKAAAGTDRAHGRAEGATRWSAPQIETRRDGSAKVQLDVTYVNPAGVVVLSEARELLISAPAADGSYTIDWRAHFTAGKEDLVLDRTPMLGEPNGAVNGGYAGLGIRLAAPPLGIAFVSPTGPVTDFVSGRARPNAPAMACNVFDGANPAGAIAILSDPANAGENAPWYLINSAAGFRFMCPAILAPKPRAVAAGGQFDLRYRIALRRAAWTPEALQAASAAWERAGR